MNRKQFNVQLRFIMRYAHKLYRESNLESFSESLRLSWAITRSQIYLKHTKVRGISYHQDVVRKLLGMNADDYRIDVVRETSNSYDPNAVAVVVNTQIHEMSQFKLKLGYLSKSIAAYANQIFKEGGKLYVLCFEITGKERSRGMLGINLTYAISTTHG